MEIRRLRADRVFGLLERNMRKNPAWNAGQRADTIFQETCVKFIKFLKASHVSIFLDDPASKVSGDLDSVELVRVATVGRPVSRQTGIVGERCGMSREPRCIAYLRGKTVRGGPWIYLPVKMGKSTVGVVEVHVKRAKQAQVKLAETFCEYLSAALQNVLDAQKRLELERKDSLTGLASGQELDLFLKNNVSRARDLSIIFIDLDYFKTVNDTWGHLIGSQLLADVGEVLRTTVLHERKMIARYGGDEFVVVLLGISPSDALKIAENIRSAIESSKSLCKPITASLGLASLTANVRRRDYRLLLKAADQAMYEAKRSGRNRVVCRR